MKINRLFFLGLIFSTGLLNAQTDYRPGYVIKNTGDTLFGEIDYRGDILMSSICKFKDSDIIISEFTPDDISAYRFINGKFFVSLDMNNRKVFMEYLIKGRINIYYLRGKNGDNYFLNKDSTALTRIPYEEGIKEIDGKNMFYKTRKHIGILNYYMQDAPQLQSRIQAIEKPNHKSLIKIAKDYHNAVCTGDKCIVYEKRLPLIKANLEFVSGVVTFKNNDFIDIYNRSYFQGGIMAHFWLPRVSDILYIKTGLLFSPVESIVEGKSIYFKLPIHFEFMAPNKYRIRPSVSIGLLSPSYSGGLEVKINKKIFIGVQSLVNFNQDNKIFLKPDGLYNYSILGSLYVDL